MFVANDDRLLRVQKKFRIARQRPNSAGRCCCDGRLEVFQRVRDALLNVLGQGRHVSGPRVPTLNARTGHHREAHNDEQTSFVVAPRALNRQGLIRVGGQVRIVLRSSSAIKGRDFCHAVHSIRTAVASVVFVSGTCGPISGQAPTEDSRSRVGWAVQRIGSP